jgi:uncharacterized protein YdeI (YjbR/CyaY-like superfamily)
MGTKDKRVDAYIAKSADFARPILEHVRSTVHAACPRCSESIKWSFPHFDYNGEILCSMAAFKQHAAFGFWKGKLVMGENDIVRGPMGSFGRITSVRDLPPRKVLAGLVKKAMALNDAGVKVARPKKHPKAELKVPAALAAALRSDALLRAQWKAFPPSRRREYLEWILGAKRDDTRARRLAQAVAQIAEGKSQNWKYERS